MLYSKSQIEKKKKGKEKACIASDQIKETHTARKAFYN